MENLKFHAFPKDSDKLYQWKNAVAKGRVDFKIGKSSRVCSNYYTDGKTTLKNPYQTLYLKPSESAKKRIEFNCSPGKPRELGDKQQKTLKTTRRSMSLSA